MKLDNTKRQIIAIFAFIFLFPPMLLSGPIVAEVVHCEVKEEELEE